MLFFFFNIWGGSTFYFYFFNFIFLLLFFFFLLYNIVLVLPYINMHLPQVYMCSPLKMIYIARDTDYIDDVSIDIKSVVFWLFHT